MRAECVNLAREAIAACLAADLALPVPEPYLVEVPQEIIPFVEDTEVEDLLQASNPIAFGSTTKQGFSVWTSGHHVTNALKLVASGILLFDAIIQNRDRHTGNPNCLVRGDDLAIIDHELAFTHGMTVNWQAPWVQDGMSDLVLPNTHIFVQELKGGETIDFEPIRNRWNNLPNIRLQEYGRSIPQEWATAHEDVSAALDLIGDAKNNIDGCIRELERILA